MGTEDFFGQSREQSRVKAEIVSKYFGAWARVMASVANKRGQNKIAYIDLFAGPGRYGDDTRSTPLLVLSTAVQEPDLRKMLVTIFNDQNPDYANSLREVIDSTPEFRQFKYKPQVGNMQVKDEIVSKFESMQLVPTLFFVDPW